MVFADGVVCTGFFFFQAEDGIRDYKVTGVQTCALPIYPGWLWLAALGPLCLAALQVYSSWARRQQLAQMAAPHFLQELTRNHSPARRLVKNIMVVLALAAAGLGLARPQWGEQQEAGQALGEDVVFILDCSRSMLATDITPNRLQRAKLAILDFMHRNTHSRLGLVAFAGQAFLQCPLTFDFGAFEDALLALDDRTDRKSVV